MAISDVENEITVETHTPAVAKEEPAAEINVLDLLIVLAQRRAVIVKAVIAGTVIGAVLAFLLPNRYTATTRILPPQQNQSLAATMMSGQLAAMGPLAAVAGRELGLKNPNDLYIGMLKSRTVEDALVWRFDLRKVYWDSRMSDARKDLEKAATITAGKDGLISISVEDKDRKRAASMANAYVEELRKLTQNVAVTEAGQRRMFFEQQVNQAKESLSAAEQALKETQQKTGMIQLDGQARAIIESVVRLRGQIAAKEVQIHAMKSFATEENPDLAMANEELAGMRAQLAKMERQQTTGGDVAIPTGNVPQAGLEYVRRLRDVKYYESIFEALAKQYELARLEEARQGAVIQVVDPAVEPDKKSSPKRWLIILSGMLLSLVGVSGWVLGNEALQRLKEVEPEQAEKLTMLKGFLFSRKGTETFTH